MTYTVVVVMKIKPLTKRFYPFFVPFIYIREPPSRSITKLLNICWKCKCKLFIYFKIFIHLQTNRRFATLYILKKPIDIDNEVVELRHPFIANIDSDSKITQKLVSSLPLFGNWFGIGTWLFQLDHAGNNTNNKNYNSIIAILIIITISRREYTLMVKSANYREKQ